MLKGLCDDAFIGTIQRRDASYLCCHNKQAVNQIWERIVPRGTLVC